MDYLAAGESLPGYCSEFTAEQLDYSTALQEVIRPLQILSSRASTTVSPLCRSFFGLYVWF
jgi:hypothetical protein